MTNDQYIISNQLFKSFIFVKCINKINKPYNYKNGISHKYLINRKILRKFNDKKYVQ